MLTKEDVEWVKDNRKETTKNRKKPIKLISKSDEGEHPVTGEPIEENKEEEIKAIVTEMDSAFKMDLEVSEGIKFERGDVWVVVDLDDTDFIDYEIVELKYRDTKYKVLAADTQGLGELNRIVIVGRKVS